MITVTKFNEYLYNRTPWPFDHSKIEKIVEFFLSDWEFCRDTKISAIKKIREISDCGLKEAKDLWELVDWSNKPIDENALIDYDKQIKDLTTQRNQLLLDIAALQRQNDALQERNQYLYGYCDGLKWALENGPPSK